MQTKWNHWSRLDLLHINAKWNIKKHKNCTLTSSNCNSRFMSFKKNFESFVGIQLNLFDHILWPLVLYLINLLPNTHPNSQYHWKRNYKVTKVFYGMVVIFHEAESKFISILLRKNNKIKKRIWNNYIIVPHVCCTRLVNWTMNRNNRNNTLSCIEKL